MENYGLVLAGGGVKGSYELGVYLALKDMNVKLDGIVGTSIGAINAALFVQDDKEKAIDLYKNININDIFNVEDKELNENLFDINNILSISYEYLKNKGLSNDALRKMIIKNIDINKIYKSPMDFGLLTLSTSDGKPVAVFKEDIKKDEFVDFLLASSCFPIFKKQVIQDKKFIDGGFYDNVPVNMLIEKGYKKLIVVDISGLGIDRKNISKDCYIKVIRPSEDIGGVMDFDQGQIQRNIRIGYLDCMKKFNKLQGHMYFFNNNEFIKMLDVFNLKTIYGLEYAANFYKIDKAREYTFEEFINILYKEHNKAIKNYELVKSSININDIKNIVKDFDNLIDKGLILCFMYDSYLDRPMSKINKYFDNYVNCVKSLIELEEYMNNK